MLMKDSIFLTNIWNFASKNNNFKFLILFWNGAAA